ncbi:hypothetical protein JX265_010459 [Neoarthrinium moseri]|uniref:Uncharacterized protein n=1 Tax=Neoarthrinium moseri TaxID=1658444 RepID=A0A9Q0AII2_9PEZI|nr:uncharacterized protein JN550_006281 [Neoarthrinium moseri]KAI1840987.1 hypothetical protein JX266_012847 [Neoarthrinium moseri]KAI1859456.1 hypothetical protein JX265_010459 [Neoarthrinium moseri]KAI1868706.1 hypothetical protein JN550_006281 [Neoarthrinium moseri]
MSSNSPLNVRIVSDSEASHAAMPELNQVSLNDRLWNHHIKPRGAGRTKKKEDSKDFSDVDTLVDVASVSDKKDKEYGTAEKSRFSRVWRK